MAVLQTLGIGVLSGVLSALLIWKFKPKPQIKICKYIVWQKEEVVEKIIDNISGQINKKVIEKNVYRFKIMNLSKRNAYDFSIYIRILYKGCYITLKAVDVPLLTGVKSPLPIKEGQITYERMVPIDVLGASRTSIERLEGTDEDICKKYNEKTLTLHDLKEKDQELLIDVILVATDSLSGTKKCFVQTLDGELKQGIYNKGDDSPTSPTP